MTKAMRKCLVGYKRTAKPIVLQMKLFVFLICIALNICVSSLNASPVSGRVFHLRQPDGTLVPVKIWGDEFYQVIESLEGYTLVRDPDTDFICYAKLSENGDELISTKIPLDQGPLNIKSKPHIRISQSSRNRKTRLSRDRFYSENLIQENEIVPQTRSKALSDSNQIRTLCLIIDFPDEPNEIPPSEVDNFCNQVGYSGFGNNGSVRDYFYDVSDGRLTYTNHVADTYYTASNIKSYYDNTSQSVGPKAKELILEALNHLKSNGFDFSQYDSDGDGRIDGINCLYAGSPQAGWGKGLWPHSGSFTSDAFTADGVAAHKYQIAYMAESLSLGIFCHETGHLLFNWPDLYDTDYESKGVGKYCLMGYGGQGGNPVEPCAYLKYINGWADTTLLTSSPQELTLTAGVNSIYKYEHPTLENEYFLIESRMSSGRDSHLADSGIALWHIDTTGWNNFQQMTPSSHYKVALIQADGNMDLEHNINDTDTGDLFKSPDFTFCGPYLNSATTNWWDGGRSDFGFYNVSSADDTMTLVFGLDLLSVTPKDSALTTGPNGGPFDPPVVTYTMSNTSDSDIEYIISKAQSWFTLDDGTGVSDGPLTGTLSPLEEISIQLGLNELAETLTDGLYTDVVNFSNLTGGIDQGRSFTLEIRDPFVTIFETDFNQGLPDGWSIIDGTGDGNTWTSDNPGGRSSNNWTETFMIIDSWWAPMGVSLDEELITQSFDFSNYKSATLNFMHYFPRFAAVADVDISVDGQEWQNIISYTSKSFGLQTLDLPETDGRSDVRIRWRYTATNDYYWGIDDVKITAECADESAADINFDCTVDLSDLAMFSEHWLDTGCKVPNGWCMGTDIDHNGTADMKDFINFSESWR